MSRTPVVCAALLVLCFTPLLAVADEAGATPSPLEQPGDPPAAPGSVEPLRKEAPGRVERGSYVSIQVNTPLGVNLVGDAANEPSIAVDPTAPNRMVIGWRQFDMIDSNFRQAGWATSDDGGRTWRWQGVLDRGQFRSDPVMAVSPDGDFYYYSLRGDFRCHLFTSTDGGRTWSGPEPAFGGDKAWVTVDHTDGIGRGNLYLSWSLAENPWGERVFSRSTDGGATFGDLLVLSPAPIWGTLAVGPDGELYIAGNASFTYDLFVIWRSLDAMDPAVTPTFDVFVAPLGGSQVVGEGPNPVGLLGQVWVEVDRSDGPNRGAVYMLGSVDPPGPDPLDVHFIRSDDRGETWTQPVRIHSDDRNAWQWFGTMSVAPDGRLDAVWVESLDGTTPNVGELLYASSPDGGASWTQPEPISPVFDSFLGFPNQSKLGDYFHMVSDEVGADLAYAATFNGEQDVYYVRLGDTDCDRNGVADGDQLTAGASDCDRDGILDSCEIAAGAEADTNGDGVPDPCQSPRRPAGRR